MSNTTYLIVDQQLQPAADLPELLKELSRKGLDIYQSRQRLVGKGLSLLARGERQRLETISPLLQQYGIRHWLVDPSKPQFAPHRIKALQIAPDKIVFSCQKKQVTVNKGDTVLAVFADMSGSLAEKSVKQLLASNAYRGRDNIRHLEDHKIHKAILQGKPLLDLYLLNNSSQIVDAVRVFPGKFNPEGLGNRATLSSVQNLDRILKLAEEYAGNFTLATDFGLANLPGCTLRRENPDDPETIRQNLISLARYGWLLADLQQVEPIERQKEVSEQDILTEMLSAATLMQNPGLAAGQTDATQPVVQEIVREMVTAGSEAKQNSPPPITAEKGLPAPPRSRHSNGWNKPSFWLGSAGVAVVAGSTFLLQLDNSGVISRLIGKLFMLGAPQFLFSAITIWSGFYFIRLKRQIENTPTSKVRSIAMGMVEVKGRALRQYALVSPMSNIPCVFYRLTKYRRVNNKWQVQSTSNSDTVPFLIEDDTGRVEIDPAGCRVTAGTKQEGVPGQVGLTRFSDESDEKWVEEVVVEGTLLYVLGFASVKKERGPSLSQKNIEALRELKRNPQELQQFDTDGDGRISEDEWELARAAVSEKVLKEELLSKRERKKQEEQIVISRRKGRPLVIAETHSEESLTQRYAIYSFTLIAIAAGLLVWGLINLTDFIR